MALLTDAQVQEIRQIIQDHHSAFIANVISPEAVAPAILERLKAKGLVSVEVKSMEDAYLYGHIVGMMDDPKLATMSYSQLKAHLKKNPIQLTDIETRALAMAQNQAAQHVVGLGNRVDLQTGQVLIDADQALRARTREEIRTATAENIAKRESVKKLKSDLGHATGDWARDWDRIAVTEKHNAMQRGVADHYGDEFGEDVLVFKRPLPGACAHCLRLHLGPDGQPRIFKLSELEANGTNFGRKAADWLPVIGSTHPHCSCPLVRMPEGWGFNEESQMVPGGELGVRYGSKADLKKAFADELELQKAFKLRGHVVYQGIPIAIENKAGTVRKWTAVDGTKGETKMLYAYGYVENTSGADGDEIDVYVGPDPNAPMVYIIHQQNPHAGGLYDEDKVMLGWATQQQALAAYRAHYDRPDFAVAVTPMAIDHFKRWAMASSGLAALGPLKKGGPVIRHVVPLQKGRELGSTGRISSEVGSAASSRAGARAPSPGTGSNLFFKVPPRPKPPTFKDVSIEERFEPEPLDNAMYAPREAYEFAETKRNVHKFVIPADWPGFGHRELGDIQTKEAEERKKRLKDERLKNKPTKNRSPVVKEESA